MFQLKKKKKQASAVVVRSFMSMMSVCSVTLILGLLIIFFELRNLRTSVHELVYMNLCTVRTCMDVFNLVKEVSSWVIKH